MEPVEDLTTKSKTIEVAGQPGTHWIRINTKDLENWDVTIYEHLNVFSSVKIVLVVKKRFMGKFNPG